MPILTVGELTPTDQEQAVGFLPPDDTFPLLHLELYASLTYFSQVQWSHACPLETQTRNQWCGVRGLCYRSEKLGFMGTNMAEPPVPVVTTMAGLCREGWVWGHPTAPRVTIRKDRWMQTGVWRNWNPQGWRLGPGEGQNEASRCPLLSSSMPRGEICPRSRCPPPGSHTHARSRLWMSQRKSRGLRAQYSWVSLCPRLWYGSPHLCYLSYLIFVDHMFSCINFYFLIFIYFYFYN